MLHLFKKVYIEFDNKMSSNFDRVVISENYGFPMVDGSETLAGGVLIDYATSLGEMVAKYASSSEDPSRPAFVAFLDALSTKSVETDKRVIIYVDDNSFFELAVTWFKMLLPNSTPSSIHNIISSHLFHERAFGDSRFSSAQVTPELRETLMISVAEVQSIFDTVVPDSTGFVNSITSSVGVEFLFASYMYDKSFGSELKATIKRLMSKDLEKYLYELKEILLVHVLNQSFQSQLGTVGTYTIDNISDIVNDASPFVQVLFKSEIWKSFGMSRPSTSGSISLDGITADDIISLREYAILVGEVWTEEKFYLITKSDMMKLDFIPILQKDEMSDADLETIIGFECVKEHASGSYSSIDTGTVNHYLIDHIIFAHNDGQTEEILPYTL